MKLVETPREKLQLVNCSASHQQGGYPCKHVLKDDSKGWAYGGHVPAWISVKLEQTAYQVNKIAYKTWNHGDHHPTLIKLEIRNGRGWIQPTWVNVTKPNNTVFQQSTGKIWLQKKTRDVEIEFDSLDDVTEVKLHVFTSDAGNNNAVIWVIEVYGTLAVDGYHSHHPAPIGWDHLYILLHSNLYFQD